MFTSLAKTGILNKFGGNDISSTMLNDEVKARKSLTKEEEPAETEAQSTEPTREKNEEPIGEKDSDAGLKKPKESTPEKTTIQTEEDPAVNQVA